MSFHFLILRDFYLTNPTQIADSQREEAVGTA